MRTSSTHSTYSTHFASASPMSTHSPLRKSQQPLTKQSFALTGKAKSRARGKQKAAERAALRAAQKAAAVEQAQKEESARNYQKALTEGIAIGPLWPKYKYLGAALGFCAVIFVAVCACALIMHFAKGWAQSGGVVMSLIFLCLTALHVGLGYGLVQLARKLYASIGCERAFSYFIICSYLPVIYMIDALVAMPFKDQDKYLRIKPFAWKQYVAGIVIIDVVIFANLLLRGY